MLLNLSSSEFRFPLKERMIIYRQLLIDIWPLKCLAGIALSTTKQPILFLFFESSHQIVILLYFWEEKCVDM